MRTFSIFKVYDYKGGELSELINLDEEQLCYELWELFDFDLDDDDITVEDITKQLLEKYNDDDFFDEYAGGDGFCGKIFEHIDNKLEYFDMEDFLPQLAQHIKKETQN